jgi:hypothetical protein
VGKRNSVYINQRTLHAWCKCASPFLVDFEPPRPVGGKLQLLTRMVLRVLHCHCIAMEASEHSMQAEVPACCMPPYAGAHTRMMRKRETANNALNSYAALSIASALVGDTSDRELKAAGHRSSSALQVFPPGLEGVHQNSLKSQRIPLRVKNGKHESSAL